MAVTTKTRLYQALVVFVVRDFYSNALPPTSRHKCQYPMLTIQWQDICIM